MGVGGVGCLGGGGGGTYKKEPGKCMHCVLYLILVTPLVEQVWPELEGLHCKDELEETDRICRLLLRRVRTANVNNMQMQRHINVC